MTFTQPSLYQVVPRFTNGVGYQPVILKLNTLDTSNYITMISSFHTYENKYTMTYKARLNLKIADFQLVW